MTLAVLDKVTVFDAVVGVEEPQATRSDTAVKKRHRDTADRVRTCIFFLNFKMKRSELLKSRRLAEWTRVPTRTQKVGCG